GVVVTAPHALHAPITIDAAAAGLHVLVEKPMATTLADCRRMIEACEKHQVRLAVGHVLRFLPPIREAKRILASGRLGRPMVINERRTATYEPGSRPEWFFDPAMAGGGIVMNVGIHSIDKVQWLADGLVVRVVAYSFSRAGPVGRRAATGCAPTRTLRRPRASRRTTTRYRRHSSTSSPTSSQPAVRAGRPPSTASTASRSWPPSWPCTSRPGAQTPSRFPT